MHITFSLAALLALASLSVSKKRHCHQARYDYRVKCDQQTKKCFGYPGETNSAKILDNVKSVLNATKDKWQTWANTVAITPTCGGHCNDPFKFTPGPPWIGYSWYMECFAARMIDSAPDDPIVLGPLVEKVSVTWKCDVHCRDSSSCGFDFGKCH
ncbi:hypothetical protein FKW77_006607 [Venturia effusa]|uniref:Uncharacterized protein n=1 Tax=Venturia effusa TaxID=50376 RepID=A0A517L3I7_9PEZI|nr:hypothetical protein FKW77_006607 [Venturia effusa]